MITAFQFLASRHNCSAKMIQKATAGKITARTVRKARQGMPAALGRVQEYLDGNGEPTFPQDKEIAAEPLSM